MTNESDEKISAYFLSFVEPNYSRSGTLFNANSKELNKEYVRIDSKWRKMISEVLDIRKQISRNSVVIVMSPAQKIAPLVRIFMKQKLILDAGWPLTDGYLSRGLSQKNILNLARSYFIDFMAFHSADLVFVESQAQLKRISRMYAISEYRIRVSYTGVNETAFLKPQVPSQSYTIQKKRILEDPKKLNVLFRGSVNNESGIDTILSAAKLLIDEVNLIVIANRERLPANISRNCFVFSYVTEAEMKDLYELSDVTLGQISSNKRLSYTIPHKAFEAGYFSKVYITPRARGISELYSSRAVRFLERTSVIDLVETLRFLYDKDVRTGYEKQIFKEYSEKASQSVISSHFEKELTLLKQSMNR